MPGHYLLGWGDDEVMHDGGVTMMVMIIVSRSSSSSSYVFLIIIMISMMITVHPCGSSATAFEGVLELSSPARPTRSERGGRFGDMTAK